ncbi:PQQ-dependent sugar dehydrogenase [Dyadobacter sp. MSC1_007]|uniref:PQQ-dependent sugar dehydrogenase n=1 Tax=Dyadobacter sp. MSC1_007 TaxID=2909264 RepID=UPI0020300AC1|nr:PQQ-dependent sugar dehydrogenase [Dyadobacter sp. MSC1_007]
MKTRYPDSKSQRSLRLYCMVFFCALVFLLAGCYGMRRSKGGGQTKPITQRQIVPTDINVMEGYGVEAVMQGLTFPTACDFDDRNRLYVIEAGYSYGEVWTEPKLIRINDDGSQSVIATGSKNGPWTGLAYHEGHFYVTEGGQMEGGKLLRVDTTGKIKILVENLPSFGDHHTNGPAIKDGYIYFGQGAATNSAVVGQDNASYGWLKRKPQFHDIPCQDIELVGQNYESPDSSGNRSKVVTGAYMPFGTASKPGQVVKGSVPCTGAVMRIPLQGGKPELVAWGLRNPYGLRFREDGKLFVTDNGYDERGSRPVWGAGDIFWEIKTGAWYGYPDFSGSQLLEGDIEFKAPGKSAPKSLLKKHPNQPPKPAAILGVHSSSNGFDFDNGRFFMKGEAFIAQFGDMAPSVGKTLSPVGFKIVRANPETGVIRDFAVNKGKKTAPASYLKSGGMERPVSVKFDRSGQQLYVVDFGILTMDQKNPKPKTGTGVIWKISKK